MKGRKGFLRAYKESIAGCHFGEIAVLHLQEVTKDTRRLPYAILFPKFDVCLLKIVRISAQLCPGWSLLCSCIGMLWLCRSLKGLPCCSGGVGDCWLMASISSPSLTSFTLSILLKVANSSNSSIVLNLYESTVNICSSCTDSAFILVDLIRANP